MSDPAAARLGLAMAMAQVGKVAMPSTLYVHRPLLNGAEVARWAKGVGFAATIPPGDMHVTIAFSRRPVDWMKLGEYPVTSEVTVPPGGPRNLAVFGEGAVVLQFTSTELRWRHEDILNGGASWDWPDYLPHVTLTYAAGALAVDTIEPFQGELRFGPEKFEPVDEDWKTGINEG